jgi:hypothetical protein
MGTACSRSTNVMGVSMILYYFNRDSFRTLILVEFDTGQGNWTLAVQLCHVISLEAHSFWYVLCSTCQDCIYRHADCLIGG